MNPLQSLWIGTKNHLSCWQQLFVTIVLERFLKIKMKGLLGEILALRHLLVTFFIFVAICALARLVIKTVDGQFIFVVLMPLIPWFAVYGTSKRVDDLYMDSFTLSMSGAEIGVVASCFIDPHTFLGTGSSGAIIGLVSVVISLLVSIGSLPYVLKREPDTRALLFKSETPKVMSISKCALIFSVFLVVGYFLAHKTLLHL